MADDKDVVKDKAMWARALISVMGLIKEVSLAVLAVVAQNLQIRANRAETKSNSLEAELTIRDKVDAIKEENKDKSSRERVDSFLNKE